LPFGDEMRTVTVTGSRTIQETAQALRERLGARYEITLHGSGTQEVLRIKQSAAALATVHLDHDSNITVFHVSAVDWSSRGW
jgi:hypothetical protein